MGIRLYFYVGFCNGFLKRARRTNFFVKNRTISYGRKQTRVRQMLPSPKTSEQDFPDLPVHHTNYMALGSRDFSSRKINLFINRYFVGFDRRDFKTKPGTFRAGVNTESNM